MWQNQGLLFDADAQGAWSATWSFAQSPQAIETAGERRIYFTARRRDTHGEWISQPFFVPLSSDPFRTVGPPIGPLLDLGPPGAFDEHGIFPFSPVRVNGEMWAYTTGWQRRFSVPVDTGIGLAVSEAGSSFVRRGVGPVLTRSLHEPFLVCDGFVRHFGGRFLMWYSFGTEWLSSKSDAEPQRIYKIGVAESDDGFIWKPCQGVRALADRRGPHECQALPSVIEMEGRLIMAYCYRDAFDFRVNPDAAYQIGFAESLDGLNWELLVGDEWVVPRAEFDSDMQAYPGLFEASGSLFLFYNGNGFGRRGFGYARWMT
jgi:hypothetical protein